MFSTQFLDSVGAWQNGWSEIQERRVFLGNQLVDASEDIAEEFKFVDSFCFRKRYLVRGELADILLPEEWDEGICSWTTDQRYAERFKGIWRENAVTAAVFCCRPMREDVVLNISALWKSDDFKAAVEAYAENGGQYAGAILNFRDLQGEVVLRSKLRRSEIIGLSGISSPFDELCDRVGIAEEHRNELFRKAVENNIMFEEPRLVSAQGAQRVLSRVIEIVKEKLPNVGPTQ